MMTEREALKLALEAFEEIAWSNSTDWQRDRAKVAITAIKEALAQPEHSPNCALLKIPSKDCDCQDQQEPVAHVVIVGDMVSVSTGSNGLKELHKLGDGAPLYTTPPQRKPMTEKRIEELYSFWVVDCQDIVGFARAVERTVKGEV